MEIEPDLTTIIATILHDSVSDGVGDLAVIEQLF
jgi:hypothetical protein